MKQKKNKNSKWILIPLRFSTYAPCTTSNIEYVNAKTGNKPRNSIEDFVLFVDFDRNSHELFSAWERFLSMYFQIWYISVNVYYWLYWNLHTWYVPRIPCIKTMKWYTGRFASRIKLKNSHSRMHSGFIGIYSVNMWNFQECCIRCVQCTWTKWNISFDSLVE